MLTENIQNNTNHRAFCYPTPQSFSDLMEMYEVNYIRLRLLCGDISLLSNSQLSLIKGATPLQLLVLEQSRYTSTIQLTYCFANQVKKPDLKIRIYHDAKQAEVISRRCHITGDIRSNHYGNNQKQLLLCRWRLNRFLYRWSHYLYTQGHQFDAHDNDSLRPNTIIK